MMQNPTNSGTVISFPSLCIRHQCHVISTKSYRIKANIAAKVIQVLKLLVFKPWRERFSSKFVSQEITIREDTN